MRMLLMEATMVTPKGPMAGRWSPYVTRHGIPYGDLVDDDIGLIAGQALATPGMVVITRPGELYAIDAAGEPGHLGLRLPDPRIAELVEVDESQ